MIDGTATVSETLAELRSTMAPFDSADQCRRFIRAAGIWLTYPTEATSREGGTRFTPEVIADLLADAKDELRSMEGTTDTSPRRTRVTRPDFRNFRG